jgi:DNA-binding LacI/PurR family transcriptional regulator
MSNIAEIGKQAGLAVSTVSDILRGRPGYNVKTTQRVKRIAKELDYRPNWLSKALRGDTSMSIGVLGCMLNQPSAMAKMVSIESAARAAGYQMYVVDTGLDVLTDTASHVGHLKDLHQRKIDGLIVDYVGIKPPDEVLELVQTGSTPTVFMDWTPENYNHAVTVHRIVGIEEAVNHLAELNHKRVAIITNEKAIEIQVTKVSAYKKLLEAAGVEVILGGDWVHKQNVSNIGVDTRNIVKRQFSKGGNLPTALILYNDAAALGALRGAYETGLRVPEDVSVIGFNDLPVAEVSIPALTTIQQPRGELGQAAFDMLLALMKDKNAIIDPVSFNCKLIVRESTGPALIRPLK